MREGDRWIYSDAWRLEQGHGETYEGAEYSDGWRPTTVIVYLSDQGDAVRKVEIHGEYRDVSGEVGYGRAKLKQPPILLYEAANP